MPTFLQIYLVPYFPTGWPLDVHLPCRKFHLLQSFSRPATAAYPVQMSGFTEGVFLFISCSAAEAERLAAAAALSDPAAGLAALPFSTGGSPISLLSDQSPVAPPVLNAAQFQYGSPPTAGASGGGGQKVLLVPVSRFVGSAGGPRQEIVSVNGRRYLRLTDETGTRLVPLVTENGAPVPAETEPTGAGEPESGSSTANGHQTAAPAEKRPRPSSVSPAKNGPQRPASPQLFEDGEEGEGGVQPLQTVVVHGKRTCGAISRSATHVHKFEGPSHGGTHMAPVWDL